VIARRPAAVPTRVVVGMAIALAGGLVIGYVDSRPGWDDTGVTAVSLALVGGLGAIVAGRAPWAVALLGGVWVPLLELSSVGSGGPLTALAFSGIGATIGWLVMRPSGSAKR
jgi:hypothetical protein